MSEVQPDSEQDFVFLGGTCNGSTWRQKLLEQSSFPYFNPVVEDWDEQAQVREREAKANAACHVFVITPQMYGVFSIAEAVHSAHSLGIDTVVCVLEEWAGERFDERQVRSLDATMRLLRRNTPATVFGNLRVLADHLNRKYGGRSEDQLKNQMQDALEEAYRYLREKCLVAWYNSSYQCTDCGHRAESKPYIRHSETCVLRLVREALVQAYYQEGETEDE